MFTKYDKAGAAVIASSVTAILSVITDLNPQVIGAIGVIISAALVYSVPNKDH